MKKRQTHPTFIDYEADSNGNIYNIKTKRLLKGSKKRYKQSPFKLDEKSYMKYHHVFVYECFNGIIPSEYDIDHIDGNSTNNKLENLQLLTRKQHSQKTLKQNPNRGKLAGKKTAMQIVAYNLQSEEKTIFASIQEAARLITKATATKICAVLKGRRSSHAGFHFKYINKMEILQDEIWACPINTLYRGIEVSNFGRVKSKRGIISFGNDNHDDYKYITVNHRCVRVHVIVCEVFNGFKPTNKYNVDHIDRNRNNNKHDNLRWVTQREQMLNTSCNKKIKVYNSRTREYTIYNSFAECAESLNLKYSIVWDRYHFPNRKFRCCQEYVFETCCDC